MGRPRRRCPGRSARPARRDRRGRGQVAPGAEVATLLLNGAVAAQIDPGGERNTAVTFVVEDGRIARIYAIRNPHKLGQLEKVAELRR